MCTIAPEQVCERIPNYSSTYRTANSSPQRAKSTHGAPNIPGSAAKRYPPFVRLEAGGQKQSGGPKGPPLAPIIWLAPRAPGHQNTLIGPYGVPVLHDERVKLGLLSSACGIGEFTSVPYVVVTPAFT